MDITGRPKMSRQMINRINANCNNASGSPAFGVRRVDNFHRPGASSIGSRPASTPSIRGGYGSSHLANHGYVRQFGTEMGVVKRERSLESGGGKPKLGSSVGSASSAGGAISNRPSAGFKEPPVRGYKRYL